MKNIIFTGTIIIILAAIIYFFSGNKKEDAEIKKQKQDIIKQGDFTDSVINQNTDSPSDTIKSLESTYNEKLPAKDTTKKQISKKVIVYYFHPTARCVTCLNIENYTHETIDSKFRKEQKDKILFFRSVNIEDSLNEHFVNDFKLTSSSVILAMYEGKKRTGWKNLEKVWALEKDKEGFSVYIKIELQQFLKKLKEQET